MPTASVAPSLSSLNATAALLARAGHLEEAERWLLLLLEQANDAQTRCLLGKVQAQRGSHAAAMASLREALRLEPTNPEARTALSALEQGAPAPGRRVVLAAVLSLAALVSVAFGVRAVFMADERNAAGLAARSAASSRVELHAQIPLAATAPPVEAERVARREAILAFAQLARELERFKSVAVLDMQLTDEEPPLRARLVGRVPTRHVRELIASLELRQSALTIDATEVLIEGRYTVRKGDSLSGIAKRLYGTQSAWPALWRANRERVAKVGRLQPGIVLELP